MTESDVSDYRGYLRTMKDWDLDIETTEAVRQRHPMLIQICYNEWRFRNDGQRFLDNYNETINTETYINHLFV